jgi:saccharopine dehydrogenase-like NADP-dependent oxidoreductase
MTTNEKQLGKLDGKVALITGGNSGIGLATAKRFVNEGTYVFITGRRKSELDVAVKEIGKNVAAVQGDVANLDDLDRLFAQIKKQRASSISCSPTLESPRTRRLARAPKSCLTEASLKSESHEYYYRHYRAVADATRIAKGARTSKSRRAEPQACCSG